MLICNIIIINFNFKKHLLHNNTNIKIFIMNKFIYLIAFFFLIGCGKEDFQTVPATPATIEHLEVKNGILVFSSPKDLQDFLNKKKTATVPITFLSQQNILDRIVEAENVSNATATTTPIHSELYKKYIKEGFIRLVKYSDGTESYNLNSSVPHYAPVANKDGFFAIGDTIYQVTPTLFKTWEKGDVDNYQKLDQYTETNESEGVYIINYDEKNNLNTRTTYPITYINQKIGIKFDENKERHMVIFYDNTIPIFATQSYQRSTYMRVIGQEKIGNTNTYKYVPFVYNCFAGFATTNDTKECTMVASNTGYDDWYSIYIPYKMMISGKDPAYTDNGEYHYMTSFSVGIERDDRAPIFFTGRRNSPTTGYFTYNINPQFNLLTEIPAE